MQLNGDWRETYFLLAWRVKVKALRKYVVVMRLDVEAPKLTVVITCALP